jgi:hypothetical protein
MTSDTLWSHREDEEHLTYETLEYIKGEIDEDAGDDVEVTVHEYKRMDIDRKALSKDIVNLVEDRFGELYCGEDGDAAAVTDKVMLAVQMLVDVVAREMPNYWFERTGKNVTKTVKEWREK